MNHVVRCRPMLGTFVEIRVEGLRECNAEAAIARAFAEIAHVHRLMSFHAPDSDVSRLHRAPPGTTIAVDWRTSEVLAIARDVAQRTRGAFDITIAPQLVRSGALPAPASPCEPDPASRWHDIELLPDARVRLLRPLWLDLGGIAKGYAVDRAIAVLQDCAAAQACVNAGGDLRIAGARVEPIHLRAGNEALGVHAANFELSDGAVATSACDAGVHIDGRTRAGLAPRRTVSVLAPRCVHADALTKVVLAGGAPHAIERLLKQFAAHACIHEPALGWRRLERAA